MQPTPAQHPDPQADPHDIVAVLAGDTPHAEHDLSKVQIGPADRTVPASPAPSLETALRLDPLSDTRGAGQRASRARPGRAVLRFLLAVGIGVAATVGWQSYGEAARQMLSAWVPQLPQLLASVSTPAQATREVEPQATPAQAEASQEVVPVQQAAAAPAAPISEPPQMVAAAPAAPAADFAPLVEELSREIASLRESVEQLKSGQQQLSRELAKAKEAGKGKEDTKRKLAATPPPPAPSRSVAAPPPPPAPQSAYARTPVPLPPPSGQQQVLAAPPPPPPVTGYPTTPRPPRPLP